MCIYFVSGLMLEQRLEMTKHLVKTSMKFNFPRVAYQRTTTTKKPQQQQQQKPTFPLK